MLFLLSYKYNTKEKILDIEYNKYAITQIKYYRKSVPILQCCNN